MIALDLIRNNKELVKENIKKKFQDQKLPLVDEVFELDAKLRAEKQNGNELRGMRNSLSSEIGGLMKEKRIEEANAKRAEVQEINAKIAESEAEEARLETEIKSRMMIIPNIIADTVPIGKDDSENVEIEKFGDPVVPAFEVPYHADILASINGLDKDSAGRTSGNGFYYLMSAVSILAASPMR